MSLLSKILGGGSKRSPQMVAADMVSSLKKAVGDDLVSVMIYGSVASGEFTPGRSNINVLVLTKRLDAPTLRFLEKASGAWRDTKGLKPMFMSTEELQRSADVFPIEFLDIQDNRRLLFGDDPFRKMQINRKNLRHQIEFEVKSKLIKYRQQYLAAAGNRHVKELIGEVLGSLMPVFRALIRLKKQRPGREKARVIEEVAKIYNLNQECFRQALELRYGKTDLGAADVDLLFEKLLGELELMAMLVDRMDADGNSLGALAAPVMREEAGVPAHRPERQPGAPAPERQGRPERGDRPPQEGRGEGRGDRGGRDRGGRGGRDRNRQERGGPSPSGGSEGGRRDKVAEVLALIDQPGTKKRWEPKEPDRFQSDPMSRDTSKPVEERFGWDRGWKKPMGGESGAPEKGFGWDNNWREKERKERLEHRQGAAPEAPAAPQAAAPAAPQAAPQETIKAPEVVREEKHEAPAPAPAAAPREPQAPAPSAAPAKIERLPEEKFNW